MPPLTQLMFGAAIAVLIALALMLLLPGCKETSRPGRRMSRRRRRRCSDAAVDPVLSADAETEVGAALYGPAPAPI